MGWQKRRLPRQAPVRRGVQPIPIEALLNSKKTRALFVGHRHLFMCNFRGEAYVYEILEPYSDVKLMPKNSALYLAPYEYQPILRFSDRNNAFIFVLAAAERFWLFLGSRIILVRDDNGWRILALEGFIKFYVTGCRETQRTDWMRCTVMDAVLFV